MIIVTIRPLANLYIASISFIIYVALIMRFIYLINKFIVCVIMLMR